MSGKIAMRLTLTRTQASAAVLRRALCSAGLTQHDAGRLIGVDARQVRRWLSGNVSLGPLELLLAIVQGSGLPVQAANDGAKEAA